MSLLRTQAGNGVVTTYEYNGMEGALQAFGDNGFRNILSVRHELGSTLLEGRSFTWDEAGNKTSHLDLRSSGAGRREREFGYDAANRLVGSSVVWPGASANNGSIGYTLDGVHNRLAVSLTGSDQSGAAAGEYQLVSDEDNGVFHAELNQYTVTPRFGGGSFGFEHAYDANGNLTLVMEYPRTADMDGNYVVDGGDLQIFQAAFQGEDPIADLNGDEVFDQADLTLFTTAFTNAPAGGFYHASLKYDERNQLIGFEDRRGGTLLKSASFRYDAFNRRIASFADLVGDEDDDILTYQVYGGQAAWQLLEEYPSAEPTPDLDGFDGSALRSFVYGLYIDEVLSMRDHASDDDYFYHQDDLFSVYALTDADGVVVERYDYGDYGQVSIMEADGTPRAESAYDNRHAFTGRFLMPELTLDDGGQIIEYRHRYMLASNGRFVQRDPLGYVDGTNLYQYADDSPASFRDPFGLCAVPLRRLLEVAGCCEKAKGFNRNNIAEVVCCGGRKIICMHKPARDRKYMNPTAQEEIDSCVMKHEKRHLDEQDYLPCGGRKDGDQPGVPDRVRIPAPFGPIMVPGDALERIHHCHIHRSHVRCLKDSLEKCNDDPGCEREIKEEIKGTEGAADDVCGVPSPPRIM